MTFWSGPTIEQRLSTLVDVPDPSCVDGAAYTLKVGAEYYVTPTDQTSDPKTRTLQTLAPGQAFAIPPGVKDYKIRSKHVFKEDRLLLSMTPHMHMRGKSFRYEAQYPGGRREVLLEVPRWDFNWQIDYILAAPKVMPAGTAILCEAHYDNSKDSPTNPDPTKWVRFGEQTWDEMMIGYYATVTVEDDAHKAAAATSTQAAQEGK